MGPVTGAGYKSFSGRAKSQAFFSPSMVFVIELQLEKMFLKTNSNFVGPLNFFITVQKSCVGKHPYLSVISSMEAPLRSM
jgi:hypothetical protein